MKHFYLKHFYLKCTVVVVVVLISFVVACGSTWNIKGNHMQINSCYSDTTVVDSLRYGESE